MARPMDPRAPIPGGQPVRVVTSDLAFRQQADLAVAAAAEAPLTRKPLRRPKEPPPVAEAVDSQQVLNPEAGPVAPPPAVPLGPAAPLASPPPSVVLDGLADDGTAIPPDTMGVAGHSHLFNPLNTGILISDLAGGNALPVVRLNDFWRGVMDPVEAFDPRAAYDSDNRRFIFACVADAERPTSSLLLGVTKGDDPTQNWTLTRVQVDPAVQGNVWLDFPSLGFSADKITVQVNLYAIADNSFQGSSVYVWDKASLYTPPFSPAVHMFFLPDQGAVQAPAVTCDPQQTTQFLVSRWSSNSNGSGSFAIYEVTGRVSDGSVQLTRTGFVVTPGTSWDAGVAGDFAPQAQTPRLINAGDDRILGVVYRNGALWFCHTVFVPAGGPARTAAQWLQVATNNWSIQQLGRVDDPAGGVFYAFPTLAVNAADDALIGLARFAAADFATAAYVFRASADAAGQMRPPVSYAPGQNTYFKTFGGKRNRWGDYSSTQVDPADDQGFWTIQEYASAQADTWATKWARVP
jgi:hypothetical protein